MSRRDQKVATRSAILYVAADEFDAKGYVGTAISDIAKRLDLTKGSVYFHFPSKAELATEIVNGYFQIQTPVLDGVRERRLTGIRALQWASHQVAVQYRDNVYVRAAVRLMRESSLIQADLPVPFVGWMRTVKTYLDQAHGAGELRQGLDLDDVAWHIVATFFGIQEVSHQLGERRDLERRVDVLWGLLLPGIAATD